MWVQAPRMKTILKLLLVAIVINACVRGGMAAAGYFRFKNAAEQAVLFGSDSTPEEIQQLIIERAQALKLPVVAENIVVNRQGGRTWADASYHQDIEVFPNQRYPMNWSFRVEGYTMVLGPPPSKPPARN